MERFANPEIFETLSLSEKVVNSLMVIGLGMGIVFLVLVVLMFSVILMSRIVNGMGKKKQAPEVLDEPAKEEEPLALTPAVEHSSEEDELEELMVVLLAASLLMEKEAPTLRITDVRVQGAPVPAWGQAALAQNTRRL